MITHKRDNGNIKDISNVFCFLELIAACAKNLQSVPGKVEEYYPTLVWIEEETQPTIQAVVNTMNPDLARAYLARTDRTVIRFRAMVPDDYDPDDNHSELDGLWMITAMSMLIDDVMQAVRDPEKLKLISPLEDTINSLQQKFDQEIIELYDDANDFVKRVSTVMHNTK